MVILTAGTDLMRKTVQSIGRALVRILMTFSVIMASVWRKMISCAMGLMTVAMNQMSLQFVVGCPAGAFFLINSQVSCETNLFLGV